jgi:hypothetical protein
MHPLQTYFGIRLTRCDGGIRVVIDRNADPGSHRYRSLELEPRPVRSNGVGGGLVTEQGSFSPHVLTWIRRWKHSMHCIDDPGVLVMLLNLMKR